MAQWMGFGIFGGLGVRIERVVGSRLSWLIPYSQARFPRPLLPLTRSCKCNPISMLIIISHRSIPISLHLSFLSIFSFLSYLFCALWCSLLWLNNQPLPPPLRRLDHALSTRHLILLVWVCFVFICFIHSSKKNPERRMGKYLIFTWILYWGFSFFLF